nr:hypothetical protein [Candidatus Microthrix sp.]
MVLNTMLSSIIAEGEPRRFDCSVGIAIAHFCLDRASFGAAPYAS